MPGELWYILGVYLAMINLTGFCLMGIDKWKAKRGAWRIAEKVLLGIGILGGALGALAGMKFFRHKTRHWYFIAINTAALTVQIILLAWLVF